MRHFKVTSNGCDFVTTFGIPDRMNPSATFALKLHLLFMSGCNIPRKLGLIVDSEECSTPHPYPRHLDRYSYTSRTYNKLIYEEDSAWDQAIAKIHVTMPALGTWILAEEAAGVSRTEIIAKLHGAASQLFELLISEQISLTESSSEVSRNNTKEV